MRTVVPGRVGIAGLLAALLIALTGCAAAPVSTAGYVSGDGSITRLAPAERPLAPTITGTTLEGTQWSSSSVAGKVLVYNVWGSWCAPCRAEAPALVAASQQTSGQAVFVGLNTRDLDPAAPKAFVRAFKVPYINLYDPDGALLLEFGGQLPPNAIPTTLLVDPQGRIAARIVGETTQATLVGLIQDLAAER